MSTTARWKRADDGLGVDDHRAAFQETEPVRAWLGGIGQCLELDGRLALVEDISPNARERGDGVEQPAHGRSQRTVHTPGHHRIERGVLLIGE